MAKLIPLTKNQFAIVDDNEHEELSKFSWYCSNLGYAVRDEWIKGKNSKRTILMHRLILGAKKGEVVDHVNRNSLDNRKENLRITNKRGNIANSKLFKTNSSGYRGVSWQKNIKKWRVRIVTDKGNIEGGFFLKIEDAVIARNKLYKEYFGDFFAS